MHEMVILSSSHVDLSTGLAYKTSEVCFCKGVLFPANHFEYYSVGFFLSYSHLFAGQEKE